MVGEEKTTLRKRLSKSREDSEENEDQRSPSRGSLETASNGRINLKQLMAKKIQLTAEAEELKPFFMKEVGSHFDDFVNSLIEKSASLDNGGCAITSFSVLEGENNHRAKDFRAPPEHGKIFVLRQSLLDELFEVDHIRTIYHMFIALLILFILSTLVVDYIDEGRLVLEFSLLSYAFGKLPIAMWTWCTMFLSTLGVPYFLFQRWARDYSRSTHPLVHSLFHCFLFMVFQIGVLGLGPTYVVLAYTLPPASRCIVILEQIRFVMKAHSFVRENVPRVLNSAKEKSETIPIPTVNQYLYFLFAPTLIYRDNYPRTPTVRWGYVAMQFLQVFGCFFYVYYIFERLCAPLFRNIKQEPFSARVLVLCVFNSILPGVLVLFLTFFAFLHCWLNAFAEMLRFGDRMFYKDWWNSTSYANYYRTWNVVVHDWLYYYAYKDFLWFFTKRFKSAAMLAVFAVSAVVHEYALAICLNFFYPVLFVLFMFFGMAFNFIVNDSRKRPIWNVMMWTSLFAGHGVILCLYSQEWYARQHCPLKNPTFLDYIRPRSWTCRYVF
ncbi:sterol O-acyltransferase 1 isoform X1 [Mustela putorius furo]|uniref:O-acyltransferase n=3 Tax=Mustela putorius furo TaxID=9669 RepID=A0A8U0RJ74_MUSPF|nr:sterol O-acyltransferase 1 isoform X1 [Mustela putorius furo]XP_044925494.1 sterol O-acyltransferase 1 isoform X1 [Mustela putorius furo]XP_044925495.1 sterol O-acyltransferase 1 isoform X1 [Mustela putorius furo]